MKHPIQLISALARVKNPITASHLGRRSLLLLCFNPFVLIGFALYAAGLVLPFGAISSAAAGDAAAAEPARWNVTGSLVTGRYGHTATLLANGQVLVAGGYRRQR